MPTVDYSKTIIYKIECENECYVGHTTNFINRKSIHKTKSKKTTSSSPFLYQFLHNRNWTMSPIEEFPCDNLIQARIREQYWIDTLKPKLNSVGSYYSKHKHDNVVCEICDDGYYINNPHSKKRHQTTHKHRFFLKKHLCYEIKNLGQKQPS